VLRLTIFEISVVNKLARRRQTVPPVRGGVNAKFDDQGQSRGAVLMRIKRKGAGCAAMFVVLGLTGCNAPGAQRDMSRPATDKDLRVVTDRFVSALARTDLTELIDMNRPGLTTDDLGGILKRYGGLKAAIVGYDGFLSSEDLSIQFRATCPSGKTVHFQQGFYFVEGSWYPYFGDVKNPPKETIPTAAFVAPGQTTPAPIPAPPPPETC